MYFRMLMSLASCIKPHTAAKRRMTGGHIGIYLIHYTVFDRDHQVDRTEGNWERGGSDVTN